MLISSSWESDNKRLRYSGSFKSRSREHRVRRVYAGSFKSRSREHRIRYRLGARLLRFKVLIGQEREVRMSFHHLLQAQKAAVGLRLKGHLAAHLPVVLQALAHLEGPNINVTLSNQKRRTLILLFSKMENNRLSSAQKKTYNLGATSFKKRKKTRKTKWCSL